jgi:AcrR family transcriptional regulator
MSSVPKVVDVDEQRKRVTDAAWNVILDHGFDGATMRSIASRADCTTGLVTHYFKSKSDLLLAMVRRISGLARTRITLAQEGRRGLDAASTVIIESLPISPQHAQEWRIWIALWDRALADPKLRREWQRRSEGWAGFVRSALIEAIDDGELSESAPIDHIVEELSSLHYGLAVEAMLTPERLSSARITSIVKQQIGFIATEYGPTAGSRPSGHHRDAVVSGRNSANGASGRSVAPRR